MSLELVRFSIDGTSAAGAIRRRSRREPLQVGVMGIAPGTSAGTVHPPRPTRLMEQTTVGTAVVREEQEERAGAAIAELRRLSGLTWEQLAQLFQVTRRSLHFWASGKPMTPANRAHLDRLLATIRQMDRGSAGPNRELLMARRDDTTALELLEKGDYVRALALVGPGDVRARVRSPRLAPEVLAARAPRPPEDLIGALQDRVHLEKPGNVTAKPIRVSREK
jgi:DNA-binding transcriptional regulator YiaG